MFKLSVIIPVFQVEDYITECLDSLVSQTFGDFEIVVVDDASADGSWSIVESYAAVDDRFTTVRFSENQGLGFARNSGIEKARGEYLVFVDSDDRLAAGGLQSIVDRLDESGRPDVLMYDFARFYPAGNIEPNGFPEGVLRQPGQPGQTFSLKENPELLKVTWASWNKAYRREFINELGLRFTSGCYEDLAWTCKSLFGAKEIALLDEVCLHYRKGRPDSIVAMEGRKHLDMFKQFALVFEYIDSHPELFQWREVVAEESVERLFYTAAIPGRLTGELMPEFYELCEAHFANYPEKLARLCEALARGALN